MVTHGRGLASALGNVSLLPFVTIVALALVSLAGCSVFSEKPFPPQDGDVVPFPPRFRAQPTRAWLQKFHDVARTRLPDPAASLLTDDLRDASGAAKDVYAHFDLDRADLGGVFGNCSGIQQTAQCSGSPHASPDGLWDGFENVWVPVGRGFSVSGQLGFATDAAGRPTPSRCIVMLPGFFGDHSVRRTRDMATALLAAGLHVLAIEIAGHGETEKRFPEIPYTFGYFEAKELLDVSSWLRRRHPAVTETGLIGFSWGANTALMSGYYASTLDPGEGRTPAQEYTAGVLAFSPVPDYDHFLRNTDGTHSITGDAVLSRLEDVIRIRQEMKQYDDRSGNFEALARAEFSRVAPITAEFEAAARDFLQLLPAPGDRGRLAAFDRPFVVVQGANDPLRSAQDVAALVAPANNPNVGAVILPGGGHVGFAAYSRSYFYSVIVRFFDPATAPIAVGAPAAE
ncbi:MAG: alpha/beta hydrolase [Planctomycetota bacterium]